MSSLSFVRACVAAMPRGSERCRPPTTTIFSRCCRSGCSGGSSKCCGRSSEPAAAGGEQVTVVVGDGGGSQAASRAAAAAAASTPGPAKPRAAGVCRGADRSLRQFQKALDVLNEVRGRWGGGLSEGEGAVRQSCVSQPNPTGQPTHQISEGQRNQIIDHIRRYSQVVPPVPRGRAGPGSDDGSDRFSFDEPAVDEVGDG